MAVTVGPTDVLVTDGSRVVLLAAPNERGVVEAAAPLIDLSELHETNPSSEIVATSALRRAAECVYFEVCM